MASNRKLHYTPMEDLDRAKNWLIDTGIVTKPLCWLLLPSFFLGCTPLYDQFAIVHYLMYTSGR